jgi:hypothetical protein
MLQIQDTHFISYLFQFVIKNFSTNSEILEMKAKGSFEKSGTLYLTERRHIWQSRNLCD